MSTLVPTGSKYSDQQRREAAQCYAIHGVMSVVSRHTGIPERTLGSWKDSDWWESTIAEVRAETESLVQARMTQIVDLATQQTIDKLPELDGKASMVVAAVAYDKLRLSQNLPGRITSNSGDAMQQLAKQFAALSDSFQARDAGVVAEQSSGTPEQGGEGQK